MLATSLFSIIIVGFSIWSFLNYGIDPKHCDGNYIQPQYILQDFISSYPHLNKRYKLFLHRDHNPDKISGFPVLFLPGNAGNYKQVRSFGAVNQRVRSWEMNRLRKEIPWMDIFAGLFS